MEDHINPTMNRFPDHKVQINLPVEEKSETIAEKTITLNITLAIKAKNKTSLKSIFVINLI